MKNTIGSTIVSPRRGLVAWVLVLFGLTALGAVWVNRAGIDPTKDFSPAIIVVAYAPSVAALVVAGLLAGVGGLRALLGQIGRWRVGLQWYALALLGPLCLVFLAHAIHLLWGGAPVASWWDFAVLGSSIGPLIAGSLGEEIGWRGFAQPLLQRHSAIFWASIIVGVLWATWHLWPVFAPGGHEHTALNIAQTYLRLVSTAVLYGWLYNATRGSLLVVMLAHAGHNIATDIMPVVSGETSAVAFFIAGLYAVAAVIVVWADRVRMFSRPQ